MTLPDRGLTDLSLEKVRNDPEFARLVTVRTRYAWILSAAMAAIYFGFILLVAFAPSVLARPIGEGITTLGIPLGISVILAAFLLTGLYVRRANSEFDAAVERIRTRATS